VPRPRPVNALAFLRLYRIDAALISFMSYGLGLLLADRLSPRLLVPGALLSLVTFNFIYSINAWADLRADALDHPRRPLPAGEVSPRAALRYSLVLLAGSVAYPFLAFDGAYAIAAALGLAALGALYSVPPVRLKRFAFLATPVIAILYVAPLTIGLQQHADPFGAGRREVVVFFAAYCLAVLPLKDVTDVAGDAADGCQNWRALLGRRRLLALSALGLAAALLVALLLVGGALGAALGVLAGSTLALVAAAARSDRLLAVLYRAILAVVVLEGAALLVVWNLLAFGGAP
jgi:homogentisate phytyltransferase/homogentisate geranylgeranyltransferase